MDTSKDGMTDIVERLRADVDINNDFVMSSEEFLEAADEIESLRKQLADCEEAVALIAQLNAELEEDNQRKKDHIAHFRRQLAESQARERAALTHLRTTSYHSVKDVLFELFENLDSTALDEAIRQAKREALLEAAEVLEQGHPHITRVGVSVALRRMADELKTTDVEQTNKG